MKKDRMYPASFCTDFLLRFSDCSHRVLLPAVLSVVGGGVPVFVVPRGVGTHVLLVQVIPRVHPKAVSDEGCWRGDVCRLASLGQMYVFI